jgi:hypothetical protein
MAKFRADGGQIAGDVGGWDGAGGFDGDVLSHGAQGGRQFVNARSHHRFAAGKDDEWCRVTLDLGEDGIDGHVGPLGVPGGVRGVAPSTPQIAPGGADEDRGDAGQFAFALQAVKELRNTHRSGTNGFERQWTLVGVRRWVSKSSEEKGLPTLDTRAAGSAVNVAAFVARPGARESDAQLVAAHGDVLLPHGDERSENLHAGVGAFADSGRHILHKSFPAIGIDGVVARMSGDHHSFSTTAFGKAGRHAEHDAIAKGNDGRLHVRLLIVPIGHRAPGLEEIGLEVLPDEPERNDLVPNTHEVRVLPGEGKFPVIVLRAVIETEDPHHVMLFPCGIKSDH